MSELSFLWGWVIFHCVCIDHGLFIHSSVNGCLGCFHFLRFFFYIGKKGSSTGDTGRKGDNLGEMTSQIRCNKSSHNSVAKTAITIYYLLVSLHRNSRQRTAGRFVSIPHCLGSKLEDPKAWLALENFPERDSLLWWAHWPLMLQACPRAARVS